MGDNIKVSIRLRNLIDREIQSNAAIHWVAKDKTTVCPVSSNSTSYSYDRVFAGHENNEVVYSEFCAPIVESVISGFNGTIFAYGQTSSGKTYTLMGNERFHLGIAHHTVCDLFEHIQNIADREFLLRVSFMEIYNNENVIDLLAKKSDENLKLQDDQYGNVKVLNLTESVVQEPDQVLELLKKGQSRRKTGETVLNQKSSRSHLIFRMIIESRIRDDENAAVNVSHFNIVDLAGSEKPSENASGKRFKEGVNINKSLLMLSQVINQLSAEKKEENQFINYRASKLTRILKNSLGGNALTAIICTVTPASYDETLSTLKFALNAKKIKNKPRVNEVENEETLIKSYANKIKELTKQLEATKEEKDQETQKRRNMQEKIEALKRKFVQFVPQNNITRATRRETWGGCLDLARMKNHFQPSRPLKLAVVDEENETAVDCPEIDKTFNGDYFRSRVSTVSSIFSIDSTMDEYSKKEDVAIQTDFLQSDKSCSELNAENESLKLYEERIANLEKELSDLKHFTTLEKQMFSDQSSDSKVMEKSNRSTLSPCLGKSDVNNLSLDDESFGLINSLINRKSESCRNVIDLDQEMFFQNLNIIIEKLSYILNIEAIAPSIAHPYFKVIYQLANIIFQKHFIGSKIFIDKQAQEMFTLLRKIFVGFSNQDDSTEQNSELIIHFDEISEKLLKDIEKLLVNSEDSSNATIPSETENLHGNIPDIINVSCSESPSTNLITTTFNETESEKKSILLSSCQCKYQIPSLEETINTHLKTINHLQSNHELIKKQLALSEDKIKIQEQVMTSLENEIKLNVKCCAELTDNFTQTCYMALLNESGKESTDKTYLPKERPSSDDFASKTQNCSNCLKYCDYFTGEDASDPTLSVIKSELFNLKLLIQKMMEDCMPKAYYDDMTTNEPSETTDATSVDSLNTEIEALKNALHKIKFYLKDRSECSEHLEKEMMNKMTEISSLQRQCSSTEMALQEKENQLNKLNTDLFEFKKEVSERKCSIKALSGKLECFNLDDIRQVDDITFLKRAVKSFADAVVEGQSALKELRQKYASKENKITQTVENYPDLAALEEVRAHEFKERAHLCKENASLKLKVEELIRKVEDLEQNLKLKEKDIVEIQNSYEREIEENVSRLKELEKIGRETMQKHIKDIEDKYEEELKNQEKSLFDMMDEKLKSLREDHKSQRVKKQQELKELEEHYEKVISQLTVKRESIKSDLQNKLTEEISNHEESKLKLEAEIRDFKNREETARKAYYKLKDKFKEYVQGVQNMRTNNAKFVKEKETQTKYENTTTAEVCNECRTLKQEQKKLTALKYSEMVSLESSNRNMMREIAALKKDLSAKSALLLTCNCRLFAKPQDVVHEVSHKSKISNAAEVACDQDQSGKTADLDPKEVLKLDIVQKAIKDARESERAIFNNGEGPASQEICCLHLQRKLAKKDKEISELKNVLLQKQFKAAPAKNPLEKFSSENIPMHPVDAEILNSFTPCTKTGNKGADDAVLKVHGKKILHDMNRPQNTEVPRNKWFLTKDEAEKAKEMEENLQKFGKEPNCKQQ